MQTNWSDAEINGDVDIDMQPKQCGTYPLRANDTIGVHLNLDAHEIAYSLNGKHLGVAHTNVNQKVYPALSLIGDTCCTLRRVE